MGEERFHDMLIKLIDSSTITVEFRCHLFINLTMQTMLLIIEESQRHAPTLAITATATTRPVKCSWLMAIDSSGVNRC